MMPEARLNRAPSSEARATPATGWRGSGGQPIFSSGNEGKRRHFTRAHGGALGVNCTAKRGASYGTDEALGDSHFTRFRHSFEILTP